jgi:hypothetical protein
MVLQAGDSVYFDASEPRPGNYRSAEALIRRSKR